MDRVTPGERTLGMRDRPFLIGALATATLALTAGSARALGPSAPAHPCRATLPRGPALPAPLIAWNDCGAFLVAVDGRIARLPHHWLARHVGGTGRRWEAQITIRRDRAGDIRLLRDGRLVWRSQSLYPNDGGSVAFGPGEFAFASYRRGVFLTDLTSGERLVVRGRGLFPYDFTGGGDLIVTGRRTIALVSRQGVTVRRLAVRARNGYAFDERSDTLFFVTPRGRLATLHDRHLQLARSVSAGGTISAQDGLLVFAAARTITVTRRDGSVVARTSWHSRRLHADSGVSVAPGRRAFAFRLSDARPGATSGQATLYLLRPGSSRPEVLYRHRLGPSGCGVGAGLSWHGRYVLYGSADGRQAIVDSATRTVTDLVPLSRGLPAESPDERAAVEWASSFGG